ncbi:MAG: SMC-Scp complex subunit ScpB [Gammaproteobacteria bacterium]|nr:SMC-Scp complex subunit ScpB [Gammaproteobacteria bacterium]
MLQQAEIRRVLEAALLASPEPVSIQRMLRLFGPGELPEANPRQAVKSALAEIEFDLEGHGYRLRQVASGYRFQVRQELSPWISRLWEEKPPRYSRALLETLALIAYRQPVTRGDIEQVRGVSVSPNIMRTLLERGWIRSVGHREVPGRPALYGTTNTFLDYFDLANLEELPPLAEIHALITPAEDDDGENDAAPMAEEIHDTFETELEEDAESGLENVVPLPTVDR